ncbi:MAG: ATP-dependent DNA helicase [Acidimicrobiales bacterium]
MTSLAASSLARAVKALPQGGEERPGQAAMASAVAAAIQNQRHLIVQAGTGTGKSLAYLVATVQSGHKAVVATATKALQDQLAQKDLPLLAQSLGNSFTYSVLKGRSNYFCAQKASEMSGGGWQTTFEDSGADVGRLGQEIRHVLAWARDSPSGDRSELGFEPAARTWSMLSSTSEECPGATDCPSGSQCFTERARHQAGEADVVIVNTHLYCAHLASGGMVLPDHDVVIFDEAHELEDVATSALGTEVSQARFRFLAGQVRALKGGASAALAADINLAGERLEAALAPLAGRRVAQPMDETLAAALDLGIERLSQTAAGLRSLSRPGDQAQPSTAGGGAIPDQSTQTLATRALVVATGLGGDLVTARSVGPEKVAWVEPSGSQHVLRIAPIDVGVVLSQALWPEITAILTSATIPASLAVRLGIPAGSSDELDVGSPFPYATNALLYCAAHLPSRNSDRITEALHQEMAGLISAAGGRTLALFTSHRAMNLGAEAMAERLGYTILTQGDLPKPALVEAFRQEESSCLFATMGFWQGIDVPGPSLSLVLIDRIPFPRPDDPLLQARRERAGPGAFRVVDLPRAAALLAQGAGRLIRSSADRGVVGVLDPRLARASYRWDLVRALPPMARTRHRSDVEAFFRREPPGSLRQEPPPPATGPAPGRPQ